MKDISIVEEYCKEIENYIVLISQVTYDVTANNIEVLENDILAYLHDKFPNMSVSKEEIHEIILKIYQTRNYNLKKEVECNLGKTKFNLEDKNQNVEKIIIEEINKLKKLFTSVKSGTNYYYLGLVDKCTQEIIGQLIRWHNSIAFSKESEHAKEYIRNLIADNYKVIMNNIGDKLLVLIVSPLEDKYNDNKTMVK
mgnify:CR=1 FL=1